MSAPSVEARAPSAVLLEDVTFRYPTGVGALDGLTLDIPSGSVVAVVGPSGCGKSTLLQLITGLQQPTRGTVTRAAFPPGVHPMAKVFQTDTLLPWKTAAQNVALHFKFRRASRAYVRERSLELLRMVGLEDFAGAYPYQLSGGMRRRVAFLAAVAPK